MKHDRARRRGLALRQARDLAKSGRHAGHASITSELSAAGLAEAARDWLQDARFLAQLDALCALSRTGHLRPTAS
jgi:hypothetical protein